MVIHIVRPGDSVFSIAGRYGVPMSLLIANNGLQDPAHLAVGQALVIQIPRETYTVQTGDTLTSIARAHGMSRKELFRLNPALGGRPEIWPGQTLVLAYDDPPGPPTNVNGYAYTYISPGLLLSVLPSLTYLTPFTYGITRTGGLIPPGDSELLDLARFHRVAPLLHLSTLNEEGQFSSELGHLVQNTPALQRALIDNLVTAAVEGGYAGVDVDFEYLPAEDAAPYAAFLSSLRAQLDPLGLILVTALAPKTSPDQPGLLYEGHDYRAVGEASDKVLLMTYEWGYTYKPCGYRLLSVAVCPRIPSHRENHITEKLHRIV